MIYVKHEFLCCKHVFWCCREVWNLLLEQIENRHQKLLAAEEIHRFNRDVEDVLTRIQVFVYMLFFSSIDNQIMYLFLHAGIDLLRMTSVL